MSTGIDTPNYLSKVKFSKFSPGWVIKSRVCPVAV